MDFSDYYQTLGVGKEATLKEIKSAYRKLARQYHPDLNPGDAGAEERFGEINHAYEVLSDEEQRAKYDEIYDYVKSGRGRRPETPRYEHYSADDLEDLFSGRGDFFEQVFGRSRRPATPRRGTDLRAEVELRLEEAVSGTSRRLELQLQETCSACGGAGVREKTVCSVCRGLGRVLKPHTLKVKVPAGVTEGTTIRLRGQGEAGIAGGPRGDILLTVRLAHDDRFEVDGHDLRMELPLSVFDAVLGGQVELDGLRGRIGLKIPAESQNGRVLRLTGQGLPRTGGQSSGDLYVKLSVRIPTGLTEEQRTRFQELRDSLEPREVAS